MVMIDLHVFYQRTIDEFIVRWFVCLLIGQITVGNSIRSLNDVTLIRGNMEIFGDVDQPSVALDSSWLGHC